MLISTDLSGQWRLTAFPDGEPDKAVSIPAEVPGSFELDFMRAGLLPDPYVGLNMLLLEKYEYWHFVYSRAFTVGAVSGREELVFSGIDTFAEVSLNGLPIGRTDNMFIPHRFAAPLKEGENELSVHIFPSVLRARENENTLFGNALKYNCDTLTVRKSAAMYGWDISPRMVSAGIWRGVALEDRGEFFFEQSYLFTRSADESRADLTLFYELELGNAPAYEFTVRCELQCGGSRAEAGERVWGKCGKLGLRLDAPRLWYPKNSGAQPLYDVVLTLLRRGEAVDERRFRTGVRTVKLDRSESLDEDGRGRFCFVVNGRPVFALGTNHVPSDSIPARGDRRVKDIIELIDDVGCNFIRVWGGGKYESDEFYSLCDEKGILVWQDFMMACGSYPQTPEFLAAIRAEATAAVRLLRQHPCIALWAGDNECDQAYGWAGGVDPNRNAITRRVLPEVVLAEDYVRPFLPSSPYMSPECREAGGWSRAPEDHLWGDRKYYKSSYYVNARALFASEMGYHGCPSPESIKKFISPEALWPYENNREWLLHASSPDPRREEPYGYRIELMANQVRVLFGSVPDNLDEFAHESQFSQAEAFKYFIERFRIKKPIRSGIIWWNIIDCWPQFSDAVVDWYYNKKLAYGFIKRSQRPLALMADEPDENGRIAVYAVSDAVDGAEIAYSVASAQSGKELASGRAVVPADRAVRLCVIAEPPAPDMLLMRWHGAGSGVNSFLTGKPPYKAEDCFRWLAALEALEALEKEGV